MKRLGAILIPIMLLTLACGNTATPTASPLSPDLEATVRAVVADVQADSQSSNEPDTDATITARVQSTVRALLDATPIPSPTPTQNGSLQGVPVRRTPASTRTLIPSPTPTSTNSLLSTPSPTPLATPSPTPECSVATDGMEVSAWVNNQVSATTLVESGGYAILVGQPSGVSFSGQTVTFKVGNSDADQTVFWVQGEATELDLTAARDGLGRLTPAEVDKFFYSGGAGDPLAQPVPPHLILGTVSVGDC